jgi:hypothetical protein
MVSSCPDRVALQAGNQGYLGQFGVAPGDFVIMVNECFGRSTYCKKITGAVSQYSFA